MSKSRKREHFGTRNFRCLQYSEHGEYEIQWYNVKHRLIDFTPKSLIVDFQGHHYMHYYALLLNNDFRITCGTGCALFSFFSRHNIHESEVGSKWRARLAHVVCILLTSNPTLTAKNPADNNVKESSFNKLYQWKFDLFLLSCTCICTTLQFLNKESTWDIHL